MSENTNAKKTNRKSIPLVRLILIIIAIGLLIVFFIKLPKMLTNKNQENTFKSKQISVEEKEKACEEIKKSLKDKDWLARNLSIKNEFDDVSDTSRKFCVIPDTSYGPIVVVSVVQDDGIGSMQTFIVKYDAGEVKSYVLSEYVLNTKNNTVEVQVDSEYGIIDLIEKFESGQQHLIYSIAEGTPKRIDVYGFCEGGEHEGKWYFANEYISTVPTITEEKYNSIKIKYQNYSFNKIESELTTENIDSQIK